MRLFCICSILLSVFAGAAFGEGTYQHTKDGKMIVWNNDPKPGDAATWFGDRDSEGYATGFGTLSWYTTQQQEKSMLYARYFGRMVRGKFDGPVNVHSKGKTDHAIFVDGQRTTRWAAGRAPSRSVAQQSTKPARPERVAEAPAEGPPAVRKTENTLATANSSSGEQLRKSSRAGSPPQLRNGTSKPVREQGAPQTPKSESFPEQAAARQPAVSESRMAPVEDTPAKRLLEQSPPTKPAATPEPASAGLSAVAEPEAQAEGPPTVRETENVQRPTPLRAVGSTEPEANAQRPMAEVASAASSAVAEPEAPAEGPRVVQAESALPPVNSLPGEQPAAPSSESFRGQPAQPPMEDTPSVLVSPSEESIPTPPTNKKSSAEVEDSLQSLVQPPSSLFEIPEIASSREASPRLTKEQVIKIANAKARTHGYNRIDYGMAEPQYNAAYKIWSVSYEKRAADGMEGKHFSIIVDDKTKGAVFMLRR